MGGPFELGLGSREKGRALSAEFGAATGHGKSSDSGAGCSWRGIGGVACGYARDIGGGVALGLDVVVAANGC